MHACNRLQAGRLLAHVLMSGAHGDRPITLIGYSMGARLVFHCLLELCRFNSKGAVALAIMRIARQGCVYCSSQH